MLKRKAVRRCSAQYYVTAEDHVENEVKHEKLLTETSRLSSSWAGLSVSCSEPSDKECSSSSASVNSSPNHRPSSFSGPLVISVTCPYPVSSGINVCCPSVATYNCKGTSSSPTHLSRPSSCYPSPVASPVSSRVQCYSPSLSNSTVSPNPRRFSNTGGASPLLVSAALGRKRGYLSCVSGSGGSSDDVSREGSPESSCCHRNNKSSCQNDVRMYTSGTNQYSDFPYFRWPPSLPAVSSPSSPSCQLFSATSNSNNSSSPSSISPSHVSRSSPVSSVSNSSILSNVVECTRSPNDHSVTNTLIAHEITDSMMDLDVKKSSNVSHG
ncbi:hypothetical protein EWB00_005345 [Schistosoma japonicum]|uniref:Uncharacterized protein n=1 Tax=Schistosoma japonicum TaxID=6182 RepID=A0A4Z2D1R2_SCHJA|nr:hypothetical protein EWB00_005345 [Schistosoma japonicum]TNN10369.1 hypothetical protein EWB00_005345 [Schistosoma japonicum]